MPKLLFCFEQTLQTQIVTAPKEYFKIIWRTAYLPDECIDRMSQNVSNKYDQQGNNQNQLIFVYVVSGITTKECFPLHINILRRICHLNIDYHYLIDKLFELW